jgi:hypothetical protein
MHRLSVRIALHGVALSLLWAGSAVAQHDRSGGELEVFVAAEAFHGSGHVSRDDADPWISADVVAGITEHQFRVFGELLVTPDERDLERFHVGFEFVPETVLWLGRFHQPASAWNTEHHHGQYLQTDITRPYIERWEDEQGLIPQHITGALLESRRLIGGDGAIQLSGGIGVAPTLGGTGMEPVSLIRSNPGSHGLSVTARLGYLPEYVGASSVGLLFGHDALDAGTGLPLPPSRSFSRAQLTIYGAYIDWTVGQWRFVGADYYVDVALDRTPRNETFMSGYLQVERQLPRRFTVFSRLEDSARMQRSRYVAFFDHDDGDFEIAQRRQALGVRWDYARRQALTVELSHLVSLHQASNQVRVQWSAAIP